MAVDDARRHALGNKVGEVLGVDDGEALMGMLPPVGWADVATRHDLDVIRADMATKADLQTMRAEFHAEINRLIFWFIPLNIGLAFAAARLG